jgi:hypothetical protein
VPGFVHDQTRGPARKKPKDSRRPAVVSWCVRRLNCRSTIHLPVCRLRPILRARLDGRRGKREAKKRGAPERDRQ